MKMKIVTAGRVFSPRLNPQLKMSAAAVLLISEVTQKPVFSEQEIVSLVEDVTTRERLYKIWEWLKTDKSAEENTPNLFWEKLGFRAADLSSDEKANLKIMLAKFIRPKLSELEDEKAVLSKKIKALENVINLSKGLADEDFK